MFFGLRSNLRVPLITTAVAVAIAVAYIYYRKERNKRNSRDDRERVTRREYENDKDNDNDNIRGIDPLSGLKKELNRNILFLDGGLGSHLNELGVDVDGDLWASKAIVSNPELVRKGHLHYIHSGANIITTSSYQASFEGFNKMYKYNDEQSIEKLIKSVNLCFEAINIFRHNNNNNDDNNKETIDEKYVANDINVVLKEPKLIAISMGAYGAHLCDGSEYNGYSKHANVNENVIKSFHIKKMNAVMNGLSNNIINNGVLFACETVPCVMEVKVLTQILNKNRYYGWISVSIKNDKQLNSDELIVDAVNTIIKYNNNNYVLGIGINCSLPRYMANIIKSIKNDTKWDKEIIIYPNNGKEFDPEIGDYLDNGAEWDNDKYAKNAIEWYNLGATIIGGCCLTTPNTVKHVRQRILETI